MVITVLRHTAVHLHCKHGSGIFNGGGVQHSVLVTKGSLRGVVADVEVRVGVQLLYHRSHLGLHIGQCQTGLFELFQNSNVATRLVLTKSLM